eukprot:m.339348 g.339348  ORF g.339348 m.339348 type:complete len:134 (-) comp18769_c0_seq1:140-541(-)
MNSSSAPKEAKGNDGSTARPSTSTLPSNISESSQAHNQAAPSGYAYAVHFSPPESIGNSTYTEIATGKARSENAAVHAIRERINQHRVHHLERVCAANNDYTPLENIERTNLDFMFLDSYIITLNEIYEDFDS